MAKSYVAQQQFLRSFGRRLTSNNVERARLCCSIIILLVICLMARIMYFQGFTLNIYIVLHTAMLMLCVTLLFFLRRMENMLDDGQRERRFHRALAIFYFLLLMWGVGITIVDQNTYGHVTTFLTTVMTASTLFITNKMAYVKLHLLPFIAIMVVLISSSLDYDIISAHVLNIVIFYIFSYFSGRTLYFAFCKMFEQEMQLSKENKELEKWNEEILKLAAVDELTKLYNRRGMYDYVEKQLAQGSAELGVMMIDVDAFKLYNDFYGHAKGDEVLTEIAQCIKETVNNPAHCVARYGGEEMIVITNRLRDVQVKLLANKIQQMITKLHITHEKSPVSPFVTVSIGYAIKTVSSMKEFMQLIEFADIALYEVKRTTRNAVKGYE